MTPGICFRVPPWRRAQLQARAQEIARARGQFVSLSAIIRELLDGWCPPQPPKTSSGDEAMLKSETVRKETR